MTNIQLSGIWTAELPDGQTYDVRLPGTLDENRIGGKDEDRNPWHPDVAFLDPAGERNPDLHVPGVIMGRFTRRVTWEGKAKYLRSFSFPNVGQKGRFFLYAERSRKLSAFLNGKELSPAVPGTLSTPWIYEVTGLLREENTLCFLVDNTYEGWPASAIEYSSAATDESQTNWNGIIGKIGIMEKPPVFIKHVRCTAAEGSLHVDVQIDAGCSAAYMPDDASGENRRSGQIRLTTGAAETPVYLDFCLPEQGMLTLSADIPLCSDVRLWDEGEGNVYLLRTELLDLEKTVDASEVTFGIRDFCRSRGPYLELNHHRIFLRSETSCGMFPEEGHTPMDVERWADILRKYQAYGVNCVRFHSWCPPEELFETADACGMLVIAELSDWDPHHALESEVAFAYYQTELQEILYFYGNHPSFVMLTFGNELHCGEKGVENMKRLLAMARQTDPTRLYANASNAFYGDKGCDPDSDFFTASGFRGQMIRGVSQEMQGYINHDWQGTTHSYRDILAEIRKEYDRPVFAFEVGQYQILPDFHELDTFHGALLPENLMQIRKNMLDRGFGDEWDRRVEASGRLALLCYREEVEAVMRTEEMSGVNLLGIQDFPGQGTALIGMMNSHLEPKTYPFADPANFRSFFRPVHPMAEFSRYTWTTAETLTCRVVFANYGKEDYAGPVTVSLVYRDSGERIAEKKLADFMAPQGKVTRGERICFSLGDISAAPARCLLEIRAGELKTTYPIYVYPEEDTAEAVLRMAGEDVFVTRDPDEAEQALRQGRKVLLAPHADQQSFPSSIQTFFSTDHWSVGTYAAQEGYMGVLADPEAPVLREFPTDAFADMQWYHLTTDSRAMQIRDKRIELIGAMDTYARLRRLAFAVEGKVDAGSLLLTSFGLLDKLQYPEARAMLKSMIAYMRSEDFHPAVEITSELVR